MGLGGQEQGLQHDPGVERGEGHEALVDQDETDDRGAEGLTVAAGGRVTGLAVLAGDTHVRVQPATDRLGVGQQVRGVGRPGPVVTVGRLAAQSQAGHRPALLVLDGQGGIELLDVGRPQTVRLLTGGQRHHEGAGVRPARCLAGILQDLLDDLRRYGIGPEVPHGVPGSGQFGEGLGVHCGVS